MCRQVGRVGQRGEFALHGRTQRFGIGERTHIQWNFVPPEWRDVERAFHRGMLAVAGERRFQVHDADLRLRTVEQRSGNRRRGAG
jgi:hypothetical protein